MDEEISKSNDPRETGDGERDRTRGKVPGRPKKLPTDSTKGKGSKKKPKLKGEMREFLSVKEAGKSTQNEKRWIRVA